MKPIILRSLLVVLFLSCLSGPSPAEPAEDDRIKKLSPPHRKWLEEEVVYVILDRERDVFLSLNTVEERDHFIEAFWRKRDPNRATPENEFKEEHYRRIEYANKFLGRETFRPGWKTDRGRMHIILGEPREIQRFDGYGQLVAQHLWFYEGDPAKGVPAFFYLLFFKKNDVGEYELYHPVVDGPNRLVTGQHGLGAEPQQALRVLRDVSPELARASLSYDTAEPPDFRSARPSLGSDILLARIYESPKRAIRADYADAWLDYGDRVSAEYSFNFIPSRSLFAVLVGPEETPFVHFSIELDPQNFAIETDEDNTTYYTTLDISVEARDKKGTLVLANDRESFVKLNRGQFDQVKGSPFAYQADFPLIPGEYKVSVILRNRVLKQYTVAERDMVIEPVPADRPMLSDVILGFGMEEMRQTGAEEGELRTFQLGNTRFYPAADGIFSLGETLHVFLQVLGAGRDHQLHFALLNGEEVLQERTTVVGTYVGGPVTERFPLRGMVGGRYVLRVRLLDPSGSLVAEKSSNCQVSPRAAISRPWLKRASVNVSTPGVLALARGDQFLARKDLQQARIEFEKAVVATGSAVPVARWRLAMVLVQMGEASRALELLTPLESEFAEQFEVVAGLGFAYSLQDDCAKSVKYLERAMTLRPPDTTLLNALGDCYQRLGNNQKAAETYERSLALKPEQTKVKERLASIQGNDH